MLDAEPAFPGAAPAGLNLVGDEVAAVLLDDGEGYLEVLFGRHDEAADSLDGLGDHAGDGARGGGLDDGFDVLGAGDLAGGIGFAQRTAVAERVHGMDDAHLIGGFAPCGDASERAGDIGAATVGVAEGDDFEVAGVHAGGVDGGLVGLRAGAGEEGFFQAAGRDVRDFFRKRHHGLVRVECGGVAELVNLGLLRAGDVRVGVADADGDDAAEEIEIALPFHVPHVLHLAALQGERVLVVVGDGGIDILLLGSDDFLAVHCSPPCG